MNKNLKFQILSILTLIIPVNIFVIGNYLGAGIQFSLSKYQITYMGSSTITIFRDITYLMDGIYSNKTALSVFIWLLGVITLIFGIFFIWFISHENNKNIKITGILIILSALLFLVSTTVQYGLFFNGPAGIVIPIGLPVLFVIGGWMYWEGVKDKVRDQEEEVQGVGEENWLRPSDPPW